MSLKFVPKEFNWQLPSIGLDNGLAPNRRQAIILTNADLIHRRIYGALGGDELSHKNNVNHLMCARVYAPTFHND